MLAQRPFCLATPFFRDHQNNFHRIRPFAYIDITQQRHSHLLDNLIFDLTVNLLDQNRCSTKGLFEVEILPYHPQKFYS